MIARLNDIQEEGRSYREAYEAILLGEECTARRLPTDEEFERTLRTRDCYALRCGFYLLSTLENSHHPKNPLDFSSGGYTIEHIMPRNALNREDWRAMLGPDCERVYDELINTLGNLTLTAYNSELSDASFAEKKACAVGGYDTEYLVFSKALHDADTWDETAIKNRAAQLAHRALAVWPVPLLPAEVIESYHPDKKAPVSGKSITFRMVCSSGNVKPGGELVATIGGKQVSATVTESYAIRLSNGEEIDSPSRAAIQANELETGKRYSINGWTYWTVGEGGPLLSDVRTRYLVESGESGFIDRRSLRVAYWDGLFGYCSERSDFLEAYGDQSGRSEQSGWYVTFGLGIHASNAIAYYARRDGWAGVGFWTSDISLYERLLARREEVDAVLLGGHADDVEVVWNDANEKSRVVLVRLRTDVSPDYWDDLYPWVADELLRIRRVTNGLR